MNNFSGQLGDPPVRENEEFIFACYAQHESEAGKIRNQSRVVNNVISGRSGVNKGSDLSLAEIALIVSARRKSNERFSALTLDGLKKNSKTQSKRRTEAFGLLSSWISGKQSLHIGTARYLLGEKENHAEVGDLTGNITLTRRLGLEYIALEVKHRFEEERQAAREKFTLLQQAGNLHSEEDEDVSMSPLFDLRKTPSPTPSASSNPDRNFAIHHTMVDFHIPFSHQVNCFPSYSYLYLSDHI